MQELYFLFSDHLMNDFNANVDFDYVKEADNIHILYPKQDLAYLKTNKDRGSFYFKTFLTFVFSKLVLFFGKVTSLFN